MEKYRKFDDASCGVNPFIPRKETRRPIWMWLFKIILVPMLVLCKFLTMLIVLVVFSLLHLLKHVLVLSPVKRAFERLVDLLLGSMLIGLLGSNATQMNLHPDDTGYHPNPAKRKFDKGKIQNGHLIIANSVCIIDTIFLIQQFSPIFTQIVKTNGKYRYRVLGFFERFFVGMGINFPEDAEGMTLKTLREEYSAKPIVVFPECTKTNGMGVLEFPESVTEDLRRQKHLHALRFDYEFDYFSLYNTTNENRFWSLLVILS